MAKEEKRYQRRGRHSCPALRSVRRRIRGIDGLPPSEHYPWKMRAEERDGRCRLLGCVWRGIDSRVRDY